MNETCIFDDCDEPAVYVLTARWPDGKVWKRNVCLIHTLPGIGSLKHFREPDAGEPSVTQVALV